MKVIKNVILHMHTSLAKQLDDLQGTANETLSGTDKIQQGIEAIKSASKELESKVIQITDTADKIAVAASPYKDAILLKPPQINRAYTDPKVLGDMDYKAKQVLVEIFDLEGNDTMAKSLTKLKDKANETIVVIKERDKPKDMKVVSILKT
jgi:hypothetical protein